MDTESLALLIAQILDPHTDAEARIECLDELHDGPRVSVRSYRSAGVLTDDDGFVLRVGKAEYQITVVQSR